MSMRRNVLLTLACALGTAPLWGQGVRVPGGAELVPASFRLSPEVVADADGVRLAHSVLLTDEMGATDYRQTEPLSERVRARKVFRLDSADVRAAELFLFGQAQRIAVNGRPLTGSAPLVSTGWTRATIPAGCLRTGDNEVVLWGGGSLLLEPGRGRGRSFKSRDAGRTWSADELGAHASQTGEYVVRLRLSRYAPHGSIVSPAVDLWAAGPGKVAVPGKLLAVEGLAALGQGQPEGTKVTAWLRTGATPTPGEKGWTDWVELERSYRPEAGHAGQRWAQVRIDLVTTRPQVSPRLRPFRLRFALERSETAAKAAAAVAVLGEEGAPGTVAGAVPFVYQKPSARLKLLRERYELDRVIAPGQTEMEQLMLLRYWVRNQWHTAWGSHPALWVAPWDALVILEAKDQPDCLTMCTHYACVFTQCCLALGWNARHCILDHHCVSEVWVDQHHKWVMMDAGNSAQRADVGLHFERGGVPLSARELHQIHHGGKTEDVRVCFTPARLVAAVAPLCRPAPKGKSAPHPDAIPLAALKDYPVCQLDNYRRYAFPPRNDFLRSLYPGEPEHGYSNYYYDGYCWVGDSADAPRLSPEYARHLSPSRPQDVDWELNGVTIHLSQADRPGVLRVEVANGMPNLARLERADSSGGKASWQPTPARFAWTLKPGVNVLEVRGVNYWKRTGRPTRVRVAWQPGR